MAVLHNVGHKIFSLVLYDLLSYLTPANNISKTDNDSQMRYTYGFKQSGVQYG
jgi:hypothetical protein